MKNRLINNNQQAVSNKINSLIKGSGSNGDKNPLNESTTTFDMKGKYLLGNKLTKINHLAKFQLKESKSLTTENIKLSNYDVDLSAGNGEVVFFLLPIDKNLFESKTGRLMSYKIQDLVDFLYEHRDISEFVTLNEGCKYFDFDNYWVSIDKFSQLDCHKQFISSVINKTGIIPDMS
jgi:hypothetical protein